MRVNLVMKLSLASNQYFPNLGNMEIDLAASRFATLGHPGRLSVFRLLMRHLPQPVRPTELGQALDLKANTLSHYLSDLEKAGLITSARDGRSILYSISLDSARGLIDFLARDCCRGRPDLCDILIPQAASDMSKPLYNVLFICSGNSARSIFAEAILNGTAGDRFRAFSAGTRPGTTLNPFAVDLLRRNDFDVRPLRSKHISEFEKPDAPQMDFVFTVCDAAADEECAPWPGRPITAHWGLPDPVKAEGNDAEKALAFAEAFKTLHKRITHFTALSLDNLDRVARQTEVDAIGRDIR